MKNLLLGILIYTNALWAQNLGQNSYSIGNEFLHQHRFEEALIKFNSAIASDSTNYMFHLKKAICLVKMDNDKNFTLAIESINKSIFYNPENVKSYIFLTRIYKKTKEYEKMFQNFDLAILHEKSKDNKLEILFKKLKIAIKIEKFKISESTLLEVKKINKKEPRILYFEAEILEKQDKFLDAVKKYENFLMTDVSLSWKEKTHFKLGDLYYRLSEFPLSNYHWSMCQDQSNLSKISKFIIKNNNPLKGR